MSQQIPQITPSEFIDLLEARAAGRTDTPLFVHGAPGIGKTQIVRQVFTERHGLTVIDPCAAMSDAVDARGLPIVKTLDSGAERMFYAPPFEFPDAQRDGERGAFFVDEMTSAPLSVQVAYQRIILEGKLGNASLPPAWIRLAAGNRPEDGAVAYPMPDPLANRFEQYVLVPSLKDWTSWALKHDIHPTILGFVSWQPGYLDPPPVEKRGKAFPSPRSLEMASKALKVGYSPSLAWKAVAGCVGEGVAASIEAFAQLQPNLEALQDMLTTGNIVLPTDGTRVKLDQAYALVSALVMHAEAKHVVPLLTGALKLKQKDVAVLFIDMLSRRYAREIQEHPEVWKKVVTKYTDILWRDE